MTDTTQFIARSPLHRWHTAASASFESQRDSEQVYAYQNPQQEVDCARNLGLVDLSTLDRVGFKGPDSLSWANHLGLTPSDNPNQSCLQDNGNLVARLSQEEILILGNPGSPTPELAQSLLKEPGNQVLSQVYSLPRRDSHCWFWVTGSHAPTLFSKVCGVDLQLHVFANGNIAQTSLARVSAIIIRHDADTTPGYYVLSDLSSAEFLWTCLLDAMEEFEGTPVGIEAVRRLTKEA